jgi:hypothetical protein
MSSLLYLLILMTSQAFACSPPHLVSCKPGDKKITVDQEKFSKIVKKSAANFKLPKRDLKNPGSTCDGIDSKTIFLNLFQNELKRSNEVCESRWKQLEEFYSQEELERLRLPRSH